MFNNLPPLPKIEAPVWKSSFLAYVLHGHTFVEHGRALQRPGLHDHMLKLDIGAVAGNVIELRVLDPEFYSERSFTAWMKRAGEPIKAGTATPHKDGKGYQLRLLLDANDGELISLHSDGPLVSADDRRPQRKRTAKPRPRVA
ncbi:hypothetical protein [Caballeronia grimmiae]|uniref:hypothetical protein n=1 Tax=Caballeronia grimmiae TaxID=1071679 RepID=UPI0038B8DB51